MEKVILVTGAQLVEAQARFFAEFLAVNPIYKALDLTERQQEILWRQLVKPLFDARFEYSFAVLREASLG